MCIHVIIASRQIQEQVNKVNLITKDRMSLTSFLFFETASGLSVLMLMASLPNACFFVPLEGPAISCSKEKMRIRF